MVVRIVKDWQHPDIFRQTPAYSKMWDGIEFTTEKRSECDLLVVLNRPASNLMIKCPPGGKWLMSQESPVELYKWHIRSFNHFDKVYTFWDKSFSKKIIHDQTALPWHINKSFDELIVLSENRNKIKQDKISWVTSNATNKPGHKIRMNFKDDLDKHKFNYDLYGRGFKPLDDKFEGIYPYKYSIAFENYSCPDYWTEKLADCFLSWALPIYYGCSNITKYFPEKAILSIDPFNPREAINTLNDAIKHDLWADRLPYIKEARELILHKYQFFPSIVEKIKKYGLAEKKSGKWWYYIPKNSNETVNDPATWKFNLKMKVKTLLKNCYNCFR